ncbi:zinc ribbon domain-containing protein [Flavobacterium sp. LB3P122]|uniref:zinc ribbon domain-containing protein n=1 Tax=Flavobacterium algoriphilum TaxID=3398738 RepID=UPI003A8545B7
MENTHFCQSCGMPLTTEESKGTENNGLKNNDYCKYCYEDSQFKNPEMNLEEMGKVVKAHMEKKKLPNYMIQKALNVLPVLKRWKNKQFID